MRAIGANEARFKTPPVGENHVNRARAFDDVRVREDLPIAPKEDAAALPLPLRAATPAARDFRFDLDDGWANALRRIIHQRRIRVQGFIFSESTHGKTDMTRGITMVDVLRFLLLGSLIQKSTDQLIHRGGVFFVR